jgi:hypothetical protein
MIDNAHNSPVRNDVTPLCAQRFNQDFFPYRMNGRILSPGGEKSKGGAGYIPLFFRQITGARRKQRKNRIPVPAPSRMSAM